MNTKPHALLIASWVAFVAFSGLNPIASAQGRDASGALKLVEPPENCQPVMITSHPQGQSLLENCPATFSVGVTGTGPYSYQWFRDEQPVPDATNSSFTIPYVFVSDEGTRIHVAVANDCSQAVSSTATVTVLLGVVPPLLLRARGDTSFERVVVTFSAGGCPGSRRLDSISAQEPLNYSLSGGIVVSNAQLDASGTNVILTTSQQSPNTLYSLRVEGVADLAGNTIPPGPGSETMFQSWLVLPGPDAKVVPPPLSLFQSNSDLSILWPRGGLLQCADDIVGPWRTLAAPDFPYRITPDGFGRFYRALFDP